MNPSLLFSKHFGVDAEVLDKAGLMDPFVHFDVPLFIDPLLLSKSALKIIAEDALDAFRLHFEQLVRLLALAETEGDPAWKAAERHLSLKEPPENGLGYGRHGRSGSSRPARVRTQVLRTAKLIIRLGAKDPEMISLMSFFEEEVGPDTISDLTTRAITDQLCQMTSSFCAANSITTTLTDVSKFPLPVYIGSDGRTKPMILVPKDVLRHLPVTENWSDVWEATEHNAALRDSVNRMLAGILKPTIAQQKEAIRTAALQSPAVFNAFLEAVKQAASHYDPNEDIFGFYRFKEALASSHFLVGKGNYDTSRGPDEVLKVVRDALGVFKHHVENGNLWEQLWAENTPKPERASQLIFYAVADAYSRVNNVDLSGEPNMGGGPVDFKFSNGYHARVLVEMKRSGGTVEHGYAKQLEVYKAAALTDFAIFVVIDYGDGGQKIRKIQKLRELQLAQGRRASEIVVIDARKKISASKR